MKKFLIVFLMLFVVAGCDQNGGETDEDYENPGYVTNYFNSMGTNIEIEIFHDDEEALKGVKDIFDLYNQLTSNFKRNEVSDSSPYYNLENIYLINLKAGKEPVVVKEELIELLKYSIVLYEETNGYINIGIGRIVDQWKNLINQFTVIEKEEYDDVLNIVNNYEEVDLNKIIINEKESTVYLEDKTIKLDLGAIAKGYATQKAYEYLLDRGLTRFKIFSGGSAISVGKHKEKRPFRFGIADDNKIYKDNMLGILHMEDKHLSVSGTENQHNYVYDGNDLYTTIHHIISPFTKKPETNYFKVALVGDDQGLLDAYSTAVFLMDEEEAINFLKHSNIGYILYLNDKTVKTNLDKKTFVKHKLVKGI